MNNNNIDENIIILDDTRYNDIIDIKIDEVKITKYSMLMYNTYKFVISIKTKSESYQIERTYSDFEWLYMKLNNSYMNCNVPKLPDKSILLSLLSKDNINTTKKELDYFLKLVNDNKTLSCSNYFDVFIKGNINNFNNNFDIIENIKIIYENFKNNKYFDSSSDIDIEFIEFVDSKNFYVDNLKKIIDNYKNLLEKYIESNNYQNELTCDMAHNLLQLNNALSFVKNKKILNNLENFHVLSSKKIEEQVKNYRNNLLNIVIEISIDIDSLKNMITKIKNLFYDTKNIESKIVLDGNLSRDDLDILKNKVNINKLLIDQIKSKIDVEINKFDERIIEKLSIIDKNFVHKFNFNFN